MPTTSRNTAHIETINPATGHLLARYSYQDASEIARRLSAIDEAQRAWARRTTDERAQALYPLAGRLRERAVELAELMAHEMGKPVTQGRAEIEKCAWLCEHFARHGAEQLADERVETEASRSYVHFAPLGLILAIMPWNYPFWQVFRCAVPALVAGNAVILKHARSVTGCALAIEKLLAEDSALRELIVSVRVGTPDVPGLIAEPRIRAIAVTGSVEAGRAVGAHAGAALKKCVLELGGSDPYLVLADADLDLAASKCATSRLQNCGQSCIAAKRLVVVDKVHDAFVERLRAELQRVEPGDPLDPDTTLGPLARHDLRDELHVQVRETVAQGAECVLGGTMPSGDGAFYPPTLLTGVRPAMRAGSDELFGPVAAVMRARDPSEAVRLANQSVFGLGAAVFSRDRAFAERLIRDRLETGMGVVNDYVRSDPRLPFGGVKDSGYGRELGAIGARELTNVKAVRVV